MPGPREKRALLEEYEAEKVTVLSLVGDFAKAHRRFKYMEDEQGFLACKASTESKTVYVNKVGTFGVASTPYWWARLSAALMRLVYWVLGEGFPNDMLLYADDLEVLTIGCEGEDWRCVGLFLDGSTWGSFQVGQTERGIVDRVDRLDHGLQGPFHGPLAETGRVDPWLDTLPEVAQGDHIS